MKRRAAATVAVALALGPCGPAGADTTHGGMHRSAPGGAGAPGDPGKPARLVPVTMRETDDGRMLFFPDRIEVTAGEQVHFRITNAGRTAHEFMLGTPAANAAHKAMMAGHPGMAHAEADGATLAPGRSADLVWRFSRPGAFEYACLIPGHYEAGMHGLVTVR